MPVFKIKTHIKTATQTKVAIAIACTALALGFLAAGLSAVNQSNGYVTGNKKTDTTPPQLAASTFNLSPAKINTDKDGQTVTVTMTVVDNASGVCINVPGESCSLPAGQIKTQVRVKSLQGNAILIFDQFEKLKSFNGRPAKNTYSSTLRLGKGLFGGQWQLENVYLVDKVGNYKSLGYDDLKKHINSKKLSFLNEAGANDTTMPSLEAIDISPKKINTEKSEQKVILTIKITDQESGVCFGGDDLCRNNNGFTQFKLKSVNGDQTIGFYAFTPADESDTYTSEITIPKGAQGGDWRIDEAILVDRMGNATRMPYDYLEPKFTAKNLTIRNIGSSEDTEAPQLLEFGLAPQRVNTANADQEVTVTIQVRSDEDSDICLPGPVNSCRTENNETTEIVLESLATGQTIEFEDFTKINPTGKDQMYRSPATLYKGSALGDWKIKHVSLIDRLGNKNFITATQLVGSTAVSSADRIIVVNAEN